MKQKNQFKRTFCKPTTWRVRGERGDTIVEVLIVLAVLSLAFVISTATANKSLTKSRNAEEHSQATGMLTSQVELVRTAVAQRVALPTSGSFCMTSGTTFVAAPAAACQESVFYTKSVSYDASTGNYAFSVNWQGAADLGPQRERINYRMSPLNPTAPSGVPLGSSPSQLKVVVKAIPPVAATAPIRGSVTPSCGSPATINKSGSSVTLTQTNGAGGSTNKITDASSVALFDSVTDYGTYKATLNSVPAGYQICPPSTSGQVTAVPGTTAQIDMKIYPVCTINTQRDFLGNYSDYQGTFADYLGYYSDYYGYYSDYLGYYADYLGTYSDYLGTYSDPYTVYYWQHDGPDVRHPGWGYGSFTTTENGRGVYYVYRGDLGNNGGPFYERWVLYAGTAWTAPYDHYSAAYAHYSGSYNHYSAPYNHYSAPYNHYTTPYPHYSAPYDHYTPYYQLSTCPS